MEGVLTYQHIYHMWQNVWDGTSKSWDPDLYADVKEYLATNTKWMASHWNSKDVMDDTWWGR